MKEVTVEVTKEHIEAAIQWQAARGSYNSISANCIIQRALKDAFSTPFVSCGERVAFIGPALMSSTVIDLPEEASKVTGLSAEQWNIVEPFKFTVELPDEYIP